MVDDSPLVSGYFWRLEERVAKQPEGYLLIRRTEHRDFPMDRKPAQLPTAALG